VARREIRAPALPVATLLASVTFARESWAQDRSNGPAVRMPGELDGKVIHLADGVTLKVLVADNFKRVVRLTVIDAPESGHGSNRPRPAQPFFGRANTLLKSLTETVGLITRCNAF
jgi:endonuclease YncB( thermonuclease family)